MHLVVATEMLFHLSSLASKWFCIW